MFEHVLANGAKVGEEFKLIKVVKKEVIRMEDLKKTLLPLYYELINVINLKLIHYMFLIIIILVIYFVLKNLIRIVFSNKKKINI
jgi:hypothetical protein